MATFDPYQQASGRPIIQQPAGLARPIAIRSSAGATAAPSDDQPQEAGEPDVAAVVLQKSPPWLISAVFHMLMLIILGLIVTATQLASQIHLDFSTAVNEVEPELIYAEKLGNQLEIDSPLATDNSKRVEDPVLTPQNLPPVDDPFAMPGKLDFQAEGTTSASDIPANQIGLALHGRHEGSKKTLLGRYGGNATTEAAVQKGLEWLTRNQRKDGSWALSGPYSDGVAGVDNAQAATAMALLAFQGAGNTHKEGKFKKNVIEGWNWLLKQQDANGNFFHDGGFNHRFYTQGMCTIAICELYGMTKDLKYKDPAERALKYCLIGQSPEGGWRYTPNNDSDVSVSGWVVMALQSAKMAGLEVPKENLDRAGQFLDKVAVDDGSRYPYQQGGEVRLSMTAEALLMRQYLGWHRNDPRLVAGANWITAPANLINYQRGKRDVYYWYYATQVCHHMEGEYWKKWNVVMRQSLPEHQVKRGRENGSWDPDPENLYDPHGGRLYVTCLSIYMLEVYYRHLPIYTKIYTDLLKSGRTPGT